MEDEVEEFEAQREHDERHAKYTRLKELEKEVTVLREMLSECEQLIDLTTHRLGDEVPEFWDALKLLGRVRKALGIEHLR